MFCVVLLWEWEGGSAANRLKEALLPVNLSNTLFNIGASLVAQRLKHLPAMWETWVLSPGWEDPLQKEMATHSSIIAW